MSKTVKLSLNSFTNKAKIMAIYLKVFELHINSMLKSIKQIRAFKYLNAI